jgi:hypothetical protein
MKAAMREAGMVNQPNFSTIWKGRRSRYIQTVLFKDTVEIRVTK